MISFRPHHFLCTLGFQGAGYSPAFIDNFAQIKKALEQDDMVSICVVTGQDSICRACPHQKGNKCSSGEKIQELDASHARIMNLKEKQVLTWREAKHLLKKSMTLDQFHNACAGCEWKALGICEAALKKLHNTKNQ